MNGYVYPGRSCKKLEEWPQLDQDAWAAALEPSDDPDRSKVAEHWAAGTRRSVVTGHGSWLTYLDEHDLLASPQPPGALVTRERVADYIAELRTTLGEFTVALRVEQLGRAMRALAPDQSWQWLQQLATQIRPARSRPHAEQTPALVLPSGSGSTPPTHSCLKLAAWPALDQAAWAAALQPGDVFEPGGVAAGWAEATRQMVIGGYGYWLTWLAEGGMLDPALSPAERVSRERVRTYCIELQARVAPFTVVARIGQLGNALRALTPEQDWHWISRAVGRLAAAAVPIRRKPERLQSPERLVEFGRTLMANADDPANGPPPVRAGQYRDGLMIALLALRPMRRRNLAAIVCDRHLIRRDTQSWLHFRPGESKTKPALEFSFPTELAANLDRYLQQHRPVLLACGGRQATPVTALWVSKHGTHMGPAAISFQIRRRTGDEFDEPLSAHLFRDCAATAVAINAPGDIGIVRAILGHTTLATSERHYNLAGSLEAGRSYSHTIKALQSSKRKKEK